MANPLGVNQYTKAGGFKQVKKAWKRLAKANSPAKLASAARNVGRAGTAQRRAFAKNPSILANLAKRRAK